MKRTGMFKTQLSLADAQTEISRSPITANIFFMAGSAYTNYEHREIVLARAAGVLADGVDDRRGEAARRGRGAGEGALDPALAELFPLGRRRLDDAVAVEEELV